MKWWWLLHFIKYTFLRSSFMGAFVHSKRIYLYTKKLTSGFIKVVKKYNKWWNRWKINLKINHLLFNELSFSIIFFHLSHESLELFLLKSAYIYEELLKCNNWIKTYFTKFLTSAELSMTMLFITLTIFGFYFKSWQS